MGKTWKPGLVVCVDALGFLVGQLIPDIDPRDGRGDVLKMLT